MSMKRMDFKVEITVTGKDGKKVSGNYCTSTVEMPKSVYNIALDLYQQDHIADYAVALMTILVDPKLFSKVYELIDIHCAKNELNLTHRAH